MVPVQKAPCELLHDLVKDWQDMFVFIISLRMIKTEEKAKVVAAVWGTEFNKFLAALAVLQ